MNTTDPNGIPVTVSVKIDTMSAIYLGVALVFAFGIAFAIGALILRTSK
jgi:hypothetical protein